MRNLVMLASSQGKKTKQNRFIKKAAVCEIMEMRNLFYLYVACFPTYTFVC